MKVNQIVIITVLLVAVLSRKGIVIRDVTTYNTFDCLVNNGFEFARVFSFWNGSSLFTNVSLTIQAAKAAGMTVDIYYVPCRLNDVKYTLD